MLKQILTFLCLMAAGPLIAQQTADAVEPESATSGVFSSLSEQVNASLAAKARGATVSSRNWMISAANPYAVEAGAEVLRQGGTAADAMVTIQLVLGLVEPQSSGLGGGAFLVWYDAETGEITTLDGRETAPAKATPRLFQNAAGEPLKFFDAVVGGLSVGTPGTPALLEMAHLKWGKTDWKKLHDPAILLAKNGFTVSPRLAALVERDADRLSVSKTTKSYFLPDGTPIKSGDTLKNPSYAKTLEILSHRGAEGFYVGPISTLILDAVQNAKTPGVLSQMDLWFYKVKERKPVCVTYRAHEVCGMGPPSSGALTVGQILGMLDNYDLAGMGPEDPQSWRLIGDASRLAFADRGRYMADSDFVPMPTEGLVDQSYLSMRAEMLSGDDALPEVAAGNPSFDHSLNYAPDQSLELPSTSHISIVDPYGNALSMTTTIENGFGSRLMAGGFLLNNELTDFSFRSHVNGVPIANAVAPGKRPRSSMAPTIVLKDGAPVLVVGSPGGSRIIGYVAKTIIAHLDWGMNVQKAVSLGHGVNRFGTFDLEDGTPAADLKPALENLGFEVKVRGLNSGLHAISIGQNLQGGADPRREGIALGE